MIPRAIDTRFLKVITWTKTLIQATDDDGDPDHVPCLIVDSLDFVEAVMVLEEVLDVEIPAHDARAMDQSTRDG